MSVVTCFAEYFSEGGGHGVCETLRLATCFDAIECFSNEAILINYTGREEVLEFARFCAWFTSVCCNESVLD